MIYTPHAAAVERAEKLIAKGAVNITDAWTFDDNDRQALLGTPNDWPGFAGWHLGCQANSSKNKTTAWGYPIGKDGQVYRSAVRAAQLQAFKQGDVGVAQAANKLLDGLDKKEPARKPWYEIKNLSDDEEAAAEIYIFNEIGGWFGYSADDFLNDFKPIANKKKINLHLSSFGGSVKDGLAIYNVFNRSKAHKTVYIEGEVDSIASVIAMAGNEVVMPENAMMLVHNPMGGAWGFASDLRWVAEALDKMKQGIVSIYRNKSGLDDAAIGELMQEQTFLTASEAIELGFADRLEKPIAASNLKPISKGGVADQPDEVRDPVEPSMPEPAPLTGNEHAEIAALCTEVGLPALIAPAIAKGTTLAEIKARLEEATAIRGLCKTAKHPEQADGYIASGLTLAQARERLFDLLVAQDRAAPIDTSLPIDTTHVSVPPPSKHHASWDRAFQSIKGGR